MGTAWATSLFTESSETRMKAEVGKIQEQFKADAAKDAAAAREKQRQDLIKYYVETENVGVGKRQQLLDAMERLLGDDARLAAFVKGERVKLSKTAATLEEDKTERAKETEKAEAEINGLLGRIGSLERELHEAANTGKDDSARVKALQAVLKSTQATLALREAKLKSTQAELASLKNKTAVTGGKPCKNVDLGGKGPPTPPKPSRPGLPAMPGNVRH